MEQMGLGGRRIVGEGRSAGEQRLVRDSGGLNAGNGGKTAEQLRAIVLLGGGIVTRGR